MELIRCPQHPDTTIDFSTLDGVLRESCVRCARRAARLCLDCGERPWSPRAHRCARHAKAYIRLRQLRTRARQCKNPECGAPVELGSKRQYCNEKCRTRRWTIHEQRRQDRSPKRRAKQIARKKAWREANPMRVKLGKRAGRLDGTWGYSSRAAYLAAMQAQNDKPERSAMKRAWAREHQTMKGRGEKPRCRNCGRVVAYKGVGAIPVHPKCRK